MFAILKCLLRVILAPTPLPRNAVNFVLDNWMLLLVALSSGAMLFMPVLRGATDAGVTAAAAVQMINREKAVLVDVCEAEEFAAGHMGGAKNIPLAQLEAKLPTVVKNKAVPLILVCQSGARSARAVATAKKLGYEKVQSLSGGLAAWKTASLPVEKS
jgi:rhodanese-related sulfurtransferase